MGRGFVEYTFLESGKKEGALYSAFIDYRLSDGTSLHIRQRVIYCYKCEEITMGEWIPSLQDLAEELERLDKKDPGTMRILAFIDCSPEDERSELLRRIEWRRQRQSLPKCLHCSTTDINFIPEDGEFNHPATGEKLKVTGRGFAATAPWEAEFSSEGFPLNSESVG